MPITLFSIGFDAFSGCSSLRRLAIPKSLREIEDGDAFTGCDSLSEITYAGDKESWEYLNHGRTLTVQRTDLSYFSPKIYFLNLKK